MTTCLQKLAAKSSKLLNDSYGCDSEYNFTRWSECDLVEYAKDAISNIYMLYPSKFTTSERYKLQPGSIQKLPENCTLMTKLVGYKKVDALSSVNSKSNSSGKTDLQDDLDRDTKSDVTSSITSSVDKRLSDLFKPKCAESFVDEKNSLQNKVEVTETENFDSDVERTTSIDNENTFKEEAFAETPSTVKEPNTANNYQIEHYSIEETSDNIFYLFPPVPANIGNVYVDIICSKHPNVDSSRYCPEVWMNNAIVEWILYRAYTSEDESSNSSANASKHLEHFYLIIRNYIEAQDRLLQTKSNMATRENRGTPVVATTG